MNHRKNPRKSQTVTTSIPAPPQTPLHTNHLRLFIWFSLIATCFKLLLIPAYHSTDFEVHRHWLALTRSLPLSQWYSDETSPWTLDYPPFFAHFEHFLSLFASSVDPTIVDIINGLNYNSHLTILFQRFSVILSDVVLFYGIYQITRRIDLKERFLTWVLVIWSPCLIIVDHIHFQYNGFLLGMLLISLSALENGKDLMGGFVFSVLLCFKHLFAVAAPVYFVYLFRHYCRGGFIRGFGRLVMIGSVVVAVFAAAYGPFLYYGQIKQVLHRMFPFGRGLCHAYWAPNFWVFYIMLDKLLTYMLIKLGFDVKIPTASFTGGLVGDSSPFAVLPTITPLISLTMVLLAMAPCLLKAWRASNPRMMTRWVAYAYTCGFMFGWHVHEKASLHFVIPLAIIALKSADDAKHYFLLSIVSCYSLFPLLYEAQEYPIKVLLLLLHCMLTWLAISWRFSAESSPVIPEDGARTDAKNVDFCIGRFRKSYLVSVLVVELVGQILHPLLLGKKLPFLPLLLISSYCAFGMMYSWIWQLSCILQA